MIIDRCKKCRELIFDWKEHKCETEWFVMLVDGSEDLVHIDEMFGEDDRHDFYHEFANCIEDAATAFCDKYNSDGDYSYCTEVIVFDQDGCPHQYKVYAEVVPSYTASEVN